MHRLRALHVADYVSPRLLAACRLTEKVFPVQLQLFEKGGRFSFSMTFFETKYSDSERTGKEEEEEDEEEESFASILSMFLKRIVQNIPSKLRLVQVFAI